MWRCCRDIIVPHHFASPSAPARLSEPVRVVSGIVPGNTALEIAKNVRLEKPWQQRVTRSSMYRFS